MINYMNLFDQLTSSVRTNQEAREALKYLTWFMCTLLIFETHLVWILCSSTLGVMWLTIIWSLHTQQKYLKFIEVSWNREHMQGSLFTKLDQTLVINNPSSFSFPKLAIQLRSSHGGTPTYTLCLPAYSSVKVPMHIKGNRLGNYQIWGIEIIHGDLFHFYMTRIFKPLPFQFQFQPTPSPTLLRFYRSHYPAHQSFTPLKINYTDEGDFQELRQYQSTDDQRRIAWMASARQGKLLSQVYEKPHQHRIAFALDLSWPMQQTMSYNELSYLDQSLNYLHYCLTSIKDHPVGLILFDHQILASLPPRLNQSPLFNPLLHYASTYTDEEYTEECFEDLVALVGHYLTWHGHENVQYKQSHLGNYPLSLDQHPIYEIYCIEEMVDVIRKYDLLPLPKGHSGPLSQKSIEHLFRQFCWSYNLPLTPRLSRPVSELDRGCVEAIDYCKTHQITHLIVLSNTLRLNANFSIKPFQKWANQGGQISWWEVQAKPVFPPIFSSLRSLVDFHSLPPLPPLSQTLSDSPYPIASKHSRKLVDFQRSYHPHFTISLAH